MSDPRKPDSQPPVTGATTLPGADPDGQTVSGHPSFAEQVGGQADDGEILDALPVLVEEQSSVRVLSASPQGALTGPVVPAVQAVALAAGGFVAGAAVVGLAHRRHGKHRGALSRGGVGGRLARRSNRPAGAVAELVQIVGTRTLLVDVHLLGGPGTDR